MTSARFFYRDPDAPARNRPDRVVVVGFVERGDTVLLEHRADCDQWCLIGGRVEPDQSVEAVPRQEVHDSQAGPAASRR